MNLKLSRAIIIGSEYFVNSTADGLIAKLAKPADSIANPADSIAKPADSIAKPADSIIEAETHSYYAEGFAPDEFFSALFTPSLFYEYKLLILKHAELLKDQAGFLAQVARGTGAAVLLLSTDSKKTAALQKAAKENGFELIMEGKKSAAKNSDIKAVFAAQGCTIDEATATQVSLLTDGDMLKIQGEAQKAGLFFYGKKPTASELIACISGQQSESVFTFLDAFMDRQKAKCLKLYPILQGADGIFYMLAAYMAGLYFKLTDAALYSSTNPLFNGKTYFMRTVDKVYRKWKPEEAAKMIDAMARLDLAVKTGRAEAGDTMLVLIGYL